jgi:hypothetical protein
VAMVDLFWGRLLFLPPVLLWTRRHHEMLRRGSAVGDLLKEVRGSAIEAWSAERLLRVREGAGAAGGHWCPWCLVW